ncbi:MAG: hotdog fold thioesterase [Proteobacteria bacterium]|nr:hotdog fold thioesterase [Pseudomonadota bacterium]
MIWFKEVSVEQAQARGKGTMMEHIDVQITEIGPDYVKATMPVDSRTKQPRGILHGGASVVLAEGIASMAGNFVLNPETHYAVGLDINANHIRSVTEGRVEGTARPLHIGRKTQVWEIKIEQESKLICISRLTLAVLEKKL